MPYFTSLISEMRAIIAPCNFFNINAAYCHENIRKETKLYLLRHIDETLNTNDVISVQISVGKLFQELLVFTSEGLYWRPKLGRPRFISYCWTSKIEFKNKNTLVFSDELSSLKITSSQLNLEDLETVFRKCQRINDFWRQTIIWDTGKRSGHTRGASLFHPVAHLLDTRPCSAANCKGYFSTDEEIKTEVREYLKNHPEELRKPEITADLDRYYGIHNKKKQP